MKRAIRLSKTNVYVSLAGSDLLLGKILRIISRDEWLAQPPKQDLTPLVLPAKRVVITHTATESCDTQVCVTLNFPST